MTESSCVFCILVPRWCEKQLLNACCWQPVLSVHGWENAAAFRLKKSWKSYLINTNAHFGAKSKVVLFREKIASLGDGVLIAWQNWRGLWMHLLIPFAQLHLCGSWRWAPGQPAVLPAPGQEKEPETSPWGRAAAQLKIWPCLRCSCWPTTCFVGRPAPPPHSVVGLPHWGSLWWVSLQETVSMWIILFIGEMSFFHEFLKWVASPRAVAMLYPLMPTTSCALISSQWRATAKSKETDSPIKAKFPSFARRTPSSIDDTKLFVLSMCS